MSGPRLDGLTKDCTRKNLAEARLGIEQGFNSLDLILEEKTDHKEDLAKLNEAIQTIDNYCDNISKQIAKIKEKGEQINIDVELLAINSTFAINSPLYAKIKSYCEVIKEFHEVLPYIEEAGVMAGGEVFSTIGTTENLKGKFETISTVSNDLLSQVREAMDIMNILSAKSWDKTKKDILKQINRLNGDLDNLSSSLQGFDLLRQIIEHRIKEVDIISAKIDGEFNWLELQEEVFIAVNKSLVTDQEKYSRDFYLPEAINTDAADSKSPGEVMLF